MWVERNRWIVGWGSSLPEYTNLITQPEKSIHFPSQAVEDHHRGQQPAGIEVGDGKEYVQSQNSSEGYIAVLKAQENTVQ